MDTTDGHEMEPVCSPGIATHGLTGILGAEVKSRRVVLSCGCMMENDPHLEKNSTKLLLNTNRLSVYGGIART